MGVEGFVIGVTFILLVMRLPLLFFVSELVNLLRFDVLVVVLLFFEVVVLLLFVVVVGEKSSSNCRLADINGS